MTLGLLCQAQRSPAGVDVARTEGELGPLNIATPGPYGILTQPRRSREVGRKALGQLSARLSAAQLDGSRPHGRPWRGR